MYPKHSEILIHGGQNGQCGQCGQRTDSEHALLDISNTQQH